MIRKSAFLSVVILLLSMAMDAAECPTGLKTHIRDGRIHFNWDCYSQSNLRSADDALKQVWNYLVDAGKLYNDTTYPKQIGDPSTSPTGTQHYYYKQDVNCDIIISTRDGRPYFVTGSLVCKDDDGTTVAWMEYNDKPIDRPATRVVEGETVSSEVNTMYYGPQTISYTKQGDKVVLYDAKRKIYGLAGSEADILPIYDEYNADMKDYPTNLDKWAHHLPLVSDDSSNAFTGNAYNDYLPCLQNIVCSSNSIFASKTVSCAVITTNNDTLASGIFEQYPHTTRYICQFKDSLPITRYDLRLSFHIEGGGYKDAVIPLVVYATGGLSSSVSTTVMQKYMQIRAGFSPISPDNDSVTLVSVLPSYILTRKQPYLDAYWGMEKVYDFYHDIFGYNSYDGKETPLCLIINGSTDYMSKATIFNAGAETDCCYGTMLFGLGIIQAEDTKVRSLPMTDLVVMGHEFTHHVQAASPSGGLKMKNESGALNESFADIMGACVEAYALGLEEPSYAIGSYKIGHDADVSLCDGARDFLTKGMMTAERRMDDTSAGYKKLPNYYKGDNWVDTNEDEGGVHTNCGVQDHWFYLLVKKIGLEAARDLCFSEIRYYATYFADYYDICEVAKAAAKYHGLDNTTVGDDSEQNKLYTAVAQCWKEVGLGDDGITAIENVNATTTVSNNSHKILRNGRIVIVRNGKEYDAMGRRL